MTTTTVAPTTAQFNTLVADVFGVDPARTEQGAGSTKQEGDGQNAPSFPLLAPRSSLLPADLDPRSRFRAALAHVTDRARLAMDPACEGRIDKAVALVLAGDVKLLPSGKAEVGSQADGKKEYHLVNGICTCRDFEQAPAHFCKHRLAWALLVRTEEMLAEQEDERDDGEIVAQVEWAHVSAKVETCSLPKECIVELHGKKFITYAGLLALAHDRGLVELEADLTTVTDTLAIARATAVFASGKRFTECADATPGNVGAKIKQHFIRMALTRAKSRALRDALNISMVALEELGE